MKIRAAALKSAIQQECFIVYKNQSLVWPLLTLQCALHTPALLLFLLSDVGQIPLSVPLCPSVWNVQFGPGDEENLLCFRCVCAPESCPDPEKCSSLQKNVRSTEQMCPGSLGRGEKTGLQTLFSPYLKELLQPVCDGRQPFPPTALLWQKDLPCNTAKRQLFLYFLLLFVFKVFYKFLAVKTLKRKFFCYKIWIFIYFVCTEHRSLWLRVRAEGKKLWNFQWIASHNLLQMSLHWNFPENVWFIWFFLWSVNYHLKLFCLLLLFIYLNQSIGHWIYHDQR